MTGPGRYRRGRAGWALVIGCAAVAACDRTSPDAWPVLRVEECTAGMGACGSLVRVARGNDLRVVGFNPTGTRLAYWRGCNGAACDLSRAAALLGRR